MGVDYTKALNDLVNGQIKEFRAFTNRLTREALALHYQHCSNEPGSVCEQPYMQAYQMLFAEKLDDLARKERKEELKKAVEEGRVFILVDEGKDDENHGLGGYI